MKRFLSILLAALLVSGSFATVSFASETVTFAPTMNLTDAHILKAGSKIIFRIKATDNAKVEYYRNEVKITPEVLVADVDGDGIFTQTVALEAVDGKNTFYATANGKISAKTTLKASTYTDDTVWYDQEDLVTGGESTTTPAEGEIGGKSGAVRPVSGRFLSAQKSNKYDADVIKISYSIYPDTFSETSSMKFPSFYYYNDTSSSDAMLAMILVYGNPETDPSRGKFSFSLVNANSLYDNTSMPIRVKDWMDFTYYINRNTQMIDVYLDDTLILKQEILARDFDKIREVYMNDLGYITDFEVRPVKLPSVTLEEQSDIVLQGTKINGTVNNVDLTANDLYLYVDGIKKEKITVASDGKFSVSTPANYSNVAAVVLNKRGDIIVDLYGNEVKDEIITRGLALTGTNAPVIKCNDDGVTEEGDVPLWMASSKAADASAYEGASNYDEIVENYVNPYNKWLTDHLMYVDDPDETTRSEYGKVIQMQMTADVGPYYTYTSSTVDGEVVYTKSTTPTVAGSTPMIYAAADKDDNFDSTDNIGLLECEFDFKWNMTGTSSWGSKNILGIYLSSSADKSDRTAYSLLYLDTNKLTFASNITSSNVYDKTEITTDMSEWHKIKIILDPKGNRIWCSLDGQLVVNDAISATEGKTFANTEAFYFKSPRKYATNSNSVQMWIDNLVTSSNTATYATTVSDPETLTADIDADGANASVKFVPSKFNELYPEEKITFISVSGKKPLEFAEYSYDENDPAYMTIGFNKSGIDKIFMWDWDSLKPLRSPFEK